MTKPVNSSPPVARPIPAEKPSAPASKPGFFQLPHIPHVPDVFLPKPATMSSNFSNVTLISYKIPQEQEAAIQAQLPAGCKLDRLPDGSACVSLVSLEVQHAKGGGVLPLPGKLGNFTEVNLRVPVVRGDKPGVVFIKELVPSKLDAAIGGALMNGPVEAVPTSAHTEEGNGKISVDRTFVFGGRTQTISVTADDHLVDPDPANPDDFLKERSWGFGTGRLGEVLQFESSHPRWQVYENAQAKVDIDFSAHGKGWSWLNNVQPFSVVLSKGSKTSIGVPTPDL